MNPILLVILLQVCLADVSAVNYTKTCTCSHNDRSDTICREWTCLQMKKGQSKPQIIGSCIDGHQVVTVYREGGARRVPLHSLRHNDRVLSMAQDGQTQIDTFIDFLHIDNRTV